MIILCSFHILKHYYYLQEIQQATASEPLTLQEEYDMQQSWRQDADKLTFIVCAPIRRHQRSMVDDHDDSPDNMLGDVNLFLRVEDDNAIVGEVELMIAEKRCRRVGYGRAALLALLKYIADRQGEIQAEFATTTTTPPNNLSRLSAKIGQTNVKSLALFESVGFTKLSGEPNYFGELELIRDHVGLEGVKDELLLERAGLGRYVEMPYRS